MSGGTSGIVASGQSLSGGNVSACTVISGVSSASGGAGVYLVSNSQTVGSELLSMGPKAAVMTGSISGVGGRRIASAAGQHRTVEAALPIRRLRLGRGNVKR